VPRTSGSITEKGLDHLAAPEEDEDNLLAGVVPETRDESRNVGAELAMAQRCVIATLSLAQRSAATTISTIPAQRSVCVNAPRPELCSVELSCIAINGPLGLRSLTD